MTVKLILAVDALSPNPTGIGRYTWELTRRLADHPEVRPLHFYRNGKWIKSPETLVKPLLVPPPLHNTGDATADPSLAMVAGVSKKRGFRLKWPRSLRQLHASMTAMACRGHIFHGPNFFIPEIADIGVATVHDLSIFKYPETHPAQRLKEFEKHFSASMARAAHLITDSEATRQEVIAFLGWPAKKITAVPLGVSAAFQPYSASAVAPVMERYSLSYKGYCLCISTLEPRKKIAELLRAYQCLNVSLRSRFPLILVGGAGWLSEQLHADINLLAAQGWLKYLGFIPEQDLPALYAGARSFVYPSIYEGFGLPVLEAMASGVPVVTSCFTSLPEVTQGAARLVNPDDIEALAEAITASLCDESWRETASTRGKQVATGYSWEQCIEQTVNVYKTIAR